MILDSIILVYFFKMDTISIKYKGVAKMRFYIFINIAKIDIIGLFNVKFH